MTAANAPIPSTPASALENERRAHEPSMEEILASIRKIIADDDALPLTRPTAPPRLFETNVTPFATPPAARQFAPVEPEAPAQPEPEPEPVAAEAEVEPPVVHSETRLDAAEMESFAEVGRELSRIDAAETDHAAEPAQEAESVEPLRPAFDDEPVAPLAVAQEADEDMGVSPPPHEQPYDEPVFDEPAFAPEPPRFSEAARDHAPAAEPAYAQQAPAGMLSAEANASVASAFQALSASVQMASAESIDRHVREMLRPMLKQWLDDNLPVMVERLVRAEIERVARGGR